jgi:hypothetical protein
VIMTRDAAVAALRFPGGLPLLAEDVGRHPFEKQLVSDSPAGGLAG